jgi:hypothetical protein
VYDGGFACPHDGRIFLKSVTGMYEAFEALLPDE